MRLWRRSCRGRKRQRPKQRLAKPLRLPHASSVPDKTPQNETPEGNGSLLIEWHRLDASKRIIRSLAIGAAIMTLGACAAGIAIQAGWVEHSDRSW